MRILIVDDHPLVRDGLRHVIDADADMEVVGEAGTAAEAMRRATLDEPDVVVLDVDLPDGSGVDACRRLRELDPGMKILMLTAYAEPAVQEAARRAGASGFVLKKVRHFELVESIRRVGQGETAFEAFSSRADRKDDPVLARLTARELSILELVAQGQTNREIAENLYLAEKTVKNYVSTVLMKMGMHHRAGAAAHFARVRSRSPGDRPPLLPPSG